MAKVLSTTGFQKGNEIFNWSDASPSVVQSRAPLEAPQIEPFVLSTYEQIAKPANSNRADAQLDSSDDESAAPALSAAAEELLGGKVTEKEAATARRTYTDRSRPKLYRGSPVHLAGHGRIHTESSVKPSSPFHAGSPRIVRIKRNSPLSSENLPRIVARSSPSSGSPLHSRNGPTLKTPAPRSKNALAASVVPSTSPRSLDYQASGGLVGLSGGGGLGQGPPAASTYGDPNSEHAASSNANSSKSKNDENGPLNSLRVKRVGKVQGRFLSGPARRGVIRRQSEEDQSPIQILQQNGWGDLRSAQDEKRLDAPVESGNASNSSPYQPSHVHFATSNKVVAHTARESGSQSRYANLASRETSTRQEAEDVGTEPVERAEQLCSSPAEQQVQHQRLVFKPVPPPQLPSKHDQENEPPPTFKRNKSNGEALTASKLQNRRSIGHQVDATSPMRKVLAPRSQNTPRRAAPPPPPPKMTMLETATATAGAASATQRRLKRQYISVNGKMFTKMECIGRGGSGRVYRVMAENFKHFALKRVSLEEVDQATIRGFKGEIDLLRKLENVDRVIRIYDFEINDDKKTLSVLMDLGELDLKKILDPRLDTETGAFDVTFTRFIWKEMLECVFAIHGYDVVHSDLKPANFVSAQGRLKLIDFGIANAIQDDTVNVHREQQIGTPNYMAPEALLDINAAGGRKINAGKLMKLGKPSDVWSLACILYQIVYGKPPFGHIANQMNKVMAITDPSHVITFPELGVGNMPVPGGLIRTMKRCLNRDPTLRPQIPELLGENDPFLHPDALGSIQINADHLRAIQHNVLRIIEAHGLPEVSGRPREVAIKQWLDQWSPQLFASVRNSIERAGT